MHNVLLLNSWNNYEAKYFCKNNAFEESSKPPLNQGESVKPAPEMPTCMPNEAVKNSKSFDSYGREEPIHYP